MSPKEILAQSKRERELGKYKGKIKTADDFNLPLDDFKDYMQ